jgi:hypothetical protein
VIGVAEWKCGHEKRVGTIGAGGNSVAHLIVGSMSFVVDAAKGKPARRGAQVLARSAVLFAPCAR